MIDVPVLEMDIAHGCNLFCDGCSHYSNYFTKGLVPFVDGGEDLVCLARTVRPAQFSLLGGEPLLNPELPDYLKLAKYLWPDSKRTLISNGLLLPRMPDLPAVLAETGTGLEISQHSMTDAPYIERLTAGVSWLKDVIVREGLDISVTFRRTQMHFYRTYTGQGSSMRPYASDAEKAWNACINKRCPTVFQGKVWKCPPLAFLGLVADRFGLRDVPEWHPYLAYDGVPVDAPLAEMEAFFARQAEPVCRMCPECLEMKRLDIVTTPYRE